jgi:hypothetical protein
MTHLPNFSATGGQSLTKISQEKEKKRKKYNKTIYGIF